MSRNENKLYLHIGEHKTGSTYIQSFLYENKDRLEEYGVTYPTFEYERETIIASKSPDYAKNGDFLLTRNFEIDSTSENFIAVCKRIQTELNKYDVIIALSTSVFATSTTPVQIPVINANTTTDTTTEDTNISL